ncbi:hypothetical protein QVZ41_14120 [Wenyingzhuangia sp. chi5]|uniref:Uncharacterized protein n=1 Tax=Wenyingzhuangia gilva TaxID=3057677 RepID=A0ABT8VVI7_9FLAO|nr:hypothetical protein [Wenyingzhuangia sp. chi5]MDO3695984.1 hypothetical protein [Wenyingzhuangia sp. chi5]
MTENFTWNIQRAGYEFDQYDFKGETDYLNFLNEFEKFPWMNELKKANQNPEKVSPTLSVEDEKEKKTFWVSISGDENQHGYIIGYIYPKMKKSFFGLGKEKEIRWLEMFQTQNIELIKKCYHFQFNREYDKLYIELNQLEKFGEMEAKI